MTTRGRLAIAYLFAAVLLWPESYSFSGDRSYSVMRRGEEITTIEGRVIIKSENKEIYADAVSIVGTEDPEFDGSGSVKIRDLEKNLVLQAREFSFSPGEALLRAGGDIRLEDGDNGIFVRCQILSVYEEKNHILMEVGVRLFKDDILCRSQYALYKRDENVLELTGFPIVYKGEDQYRADRITVNLDTDEIVMTGRIEGALRTEAEGEKQNG